MLKIKQYKKLIFIFTILVILCCFFYLIFKNKSYELTYIINDIEINEKFDQENQIYQFIFKKDDKEYISIFKNKYIHQKKLVKSIELKENETTNCIIPKGQKLDYYPLCYENNELISYHQLQTKDLIPQEYYQNIESKNDNYNKIQINYLNNKKFFIWNYKGFDIISNKKNKTINIFTNDIYNIPLSSKNNNYILLADYNSKYKFNKFYIINSKNNKVKELVTDKEISFDSYILGNYKDKIYFMDKKNKKEYEINPQKLKLENISKKNQGSILNDDKWEKISLTKLSTKEYKFSPNNNFNYQIIDNKLYLICDKYKTLISHFDIKEIIEIDNDTIYYLVDDKLYMYNNLLGEVLLLSNFEWNFNYQNMIYIF